MQKAGQDGGSKRRFTGNYGRAALLVSLVLALLAGISAPQALTQQSCDQHQLVAQILTSVGQFALNKLADIPLTKGRE
jgi:hypothetical protein